MGFDGLITEDEQHTQQEEGGTAADEASPALPVEESAIAEDPFADDGFPGDAMTIVADEADGGALEPLVEDDEAMGGADESVRIPPIALTPEVSARICDCLRQAIAELDERLVQARALGEREAFYGGWAAVIEQRRARYAAALERTLPNAEGAVPLAIGG